MTLATFVALWIGAEKRSVTLASIAAAITAVASASALSIETILGSPGTEFLRSHNIGAQYNTDIELNAIAVAIVGVLALGGGGVLGFLSKTSANVLFGSSCDASGGEPFRAPERRQRVS